MIELKYCGPRSLRPVSENLANKVKNFKIIFILFKTMAYLTGHLNISVIYFYLPFFTQERVGDEIPWPGQLALGDEDTLAWAACPHPHPPLPALSTHAPHPWKLDKLRSEKFFHHFKHKFLKHRHWNCSSTCFYQLFSLQEGVKVKILWPEKFAPSLRLSCKGIQKVIFVFFFFF